MAVFFRSLILLELKNKGIETTKEEVRENLIQRDLIDSNRKESPPKRAEDANCFG
ncbi:MAG: hypothetical protein ACKO6J_07005 [Crocinitomicaceae bacterium]